MPSEPPLARALHAVRSALVLASLLVVPLLLDEELLWPPPGGAAAIDGTLEVKGAALQVTAWTALACLLGAVAAGGGVVRGARAERGFAATVLGFVLIAAASCGWAAQRNAAVESSVLLASAAVVGLFAGWRARSVKGATVVLSTLALGALVACGADLAARRCGLAAPPTVEGASKFHSLWFPHANVEALFLAPVAGMAVLAAVVAPAGRLRVASAGAAAVAVALLVELGSRAALLALVAGPSIWFVLRALDATKAAAGPRRRVALAAAGVACVFVATFVPRHPTVSAVLKEGFNRVVAATGANYHAAYMRPGLWKSTFEIARDREVFGVGAGNFFYELPRVDSLEPYRSHAHNQYLQVYAELGGAGLLLWIGVLGFGVAGALAAARSLDRKRRALGAGTGGGLLVLAAHALFETPLEFPFTATLTFALAAAAVSLGFGGDAEDPRTARAAPLDRVGRLGPLARWTAALAALVSLGAGIPAAVAPVRQLELLRDGVRAGAEGDLDGAVLRFARAAEVGRDHYAIHVPWAVLEMGRHRFAEAEREWGRAVALFPNAWRFHEQRAVALAQLGRRDEALAALDRVVRLEPSAPDVLFWRGRILLDAARLDEAIDALRQHGAAHPGHGASRLALADACYARALRDRSLADAEEALTLYRRHLAEGVPDPDGWISRRCTRVDTWLHRREIDVAPGEAPAPSNDPQKMDDTTPSPMEG